MRKQINRRSLLKGLGTVGIGLPLMEEMVTTKAYGADQKNVPTRASVSYTHLTLPTTPYV